MPLWSRLRNRIFRIDRHTHVVIDRFYEVTDDRWEISHVARRDTPGWPVPLSHQCYPNFAFDPLSKKGSDGYSIGSWADNGFHESFAVDTVILSSDGNHSEEHDEDYWKEYAIEMSLYEDTCESPFFSTINRLSIDGAHLPSTDTHPRPAQPPFTSIDTTSDASIDIEAAALIKDIRNIPIPSWFNTYIKGFAPQISPQKFKAEKLTLSQNHQQIFPWTAF